MEETEWRQKSKAIWLQARDNNTRFFHSVASQRKRSNHITPMHIGGMARHRQEDIATHLVAHFSWAFRRSRRWFPKWNDEALPHLSEEQRNSLSCPFQEEEIRHVIFSAEGDKAPGPDGFTFRFFQTFWTLVKADILQDGYLVAQEIIAALTKDRRSGIALKLDFAKA
ncbi:hypothetical protein QJS10_CPB22g00397 [Acorus calamus]|uniref:Reverse transcriptase n=1 Tax=Acorus calamus TaxID=4465 RepID=A0AAV9C1H9_ACOCL|nr:hypothetical protein QJS10_CPB22g00397 [Acorus calamus]